MRHNKGVLSFGKHIERISQLKHRNFFVDKAFNFRLNGAYKLKSFTAFVIQACSVFNLIVWFRKKLFVLWRCERNKMIPNYILFLSCECVSTLRRFRLTCCSHRLNWSFLNCTCRLSFVWLIKHLLASVHCKSSTPEAMYARVCVWANVQSHCAMPHILHLLNDVWKNPSSEHLPLRIQWSGYGNVFPHFS